MFKLFAKKSLGQNFLINQGVIERIIQAAEINSNDCILEIGPGTGNLTKALAKSAGTVIAIEKDARAIEILKHEMPSNVRMIEGDGLTYDVNSLALNHYKVVANLPYYITSHFLRVMLEDWPQPELAVLMVQKEVAQRIMAKPPQMNMLALSVQFYADVEKVMDVSRGSFRPMPTVDSTVIKLITKTTDMAHENYKKVFEIARHCFAGKRKQLVGTLPEAMGKSRSEIIAILEKINISPMDRPETLRVEDWIALVNNVY